MFVTQEPLPDGSYNRFLTLTEEQAKEELLKAWSTPAQREYNRSTRTCSTCRGRGYLSRKLGKRGQFDNEKCGCPVCLGLGKVPG